jgi:hypothetical protein
MIRVPGGTRNDRLAQIVTPVAMPINTMISRLFQLTSLLALAGCSFFFSACTHYSTVALGGPDPEQFVRTGHGPYGYSPPHYGLAQGASASAANRIEIIGANYGVGDRFVDVTPQVRGFVTGDAARIRVTHGNLLIDRANDPAPGERKALVVTYRTADGVQHVVSAEDYDYLIIGNPSAIRN